MALFFAKKTLCLFEVDLKAAPPLPCVARLAVDFHRLDMAAWAVQPNTTHMPDRHLFSARLERGEHFWTAQHNSTIVSYCWATRDPVEIGEIHSVMSPRGDELYLYDAFTFAAYRGYSLYPALLQRMLDYSREMGFRRALIFVLSDNVASIRGVQKAGFREFQRVTYRNVFGFARYAYQPLLSTSTGVDLLPA